MGYIGREPTNSGQFLLIDDISGEFNGSKSSFTLKIGGIEITPAASNTIIALDGVLQEANDAYSISGSTIAFTGAPGSEFTFYGVLAGQSQYISNNSITDEHISPTADISGSKINTNFGGQTVTAKDFGGNISGSISSTGSFGRLEIAGNTNLTGDIEFDDVTATGNIITTGTNKVISGSITSTGSFGTIQTTNGTIPTLIGNTTFSDNLTVGGNLDIADTIFHTGDSNTKIRFPEVDTISFHTSGNERMRISAGGQITASGNLEVTGNISGSITSTGSFGRVNSTTIDIDSIQGNWTNAGNTVADLGVITTVDINGGTVDGITSLTAGGDLDIGAHDLRAATLTADSLTATRVPFAGTDGVLSDDSDLTFATATLSATNLTSTGTIKDFASVSGSFVSTGSVGRIQTRTADIGIVTGTSLTTTGNISGSTTSTGSFGRLQTQQANALIGGNVVTLGGNLTTAGTLTTQNNNVTINAAGAARTLTLNESLTIGDGHDGTITFGAASKTLTVENTSLLNQDLTTDASPTFAGATITGTLTVQEVHTEFESASILFTSGSTKFGNSTDDVHNVTGSMKITGSFQVDNGTLTAGTVDINGGTIDGITSLTAGGDLDIGSHDFRAATLTADGLTSGRVPFAGTAGVLSDDSDLTFATATLSATNLTTTGTIKNMALVSGSSVSTGSFGRVNTATIDIDSIQGNWTNAGNTVADLGTVTTADINGGTIDGITSLTAGGDLDIGAHDLRAATITADGLTATRVPFAGTAGVLSDDSDLTFATATLSATNLTTTGTIKNMALVSGSSTSTGSFGRVQVGTTAAPVGKTILDVRAAGANSDVDTASILNLKQETASTTANLRFNTVTNNSAGHIIFNTDGSFQIRTDGSNLTTFANDGSATFPAMLKIDNDTEAIFRAYRGSRYTELAQNSSGGVLTFQDSSGNTGVQLNSYGLSRYVNDVLIGNAGGNENSIGHASYDNPSQRVEINGTWASPTHGDGSNAGNTGAIFRLAGGGHSNALDFGVEDASPYPAWIQGTDRGSSDGHAGTYGLCLNPQGGDVSVGTISPSSNFHVFGDPGDNDTLCILQNSHGSVDDDDGILRLMFSGDASAENGHFIEFRDGNTDDDLTGTIICSSGTATNNTVSDYRTKENISLITGSLANVNALKPSYFNYKRFPDKVHQGFVAHEVQEAGIGYAVKGDKDAVKDNGDMKIQQFAVTNIIPQMVNAIQELTQAHRDLRAQITGSTDINQLKALVSGSTFV